MAATVPKEEQSENICDDMGMNPDNHVIVKEHPTKDEGDP